MKVVVVAQGFPPDPGGVEAVTGSLARHVALAGEEVVVLAHGRQRQDATTPEGVSVRRYRSYLGEFAVSPQLARALRAEQATVWHAHAVHSSLPALVWAARRRPYVLNPHFHGGGHTPRARVMHHPYRPLLREIVQSASAVIAVSHYEASLLEARFDIATEVIPNGIELRRLRAVRRSSGDRGYVQVLVVGRLSGYKRVGIVIRALAFLPEDYRLVVHGQGPEAAGLQRLARDVGVHKRVRFQESHLPDEGLWQLIADADVLVNLSTAEAFSLVVLEALALGTPVVLSASGALQEWSERFPSEVTAVKGPTARGVAKAVERSVGRRVSPDLRAYDWAAVSSRLLGVYRRVAS